ncbi:PKD domain-containing protein [Dysgonomonas capnocytophagoides]|uniref:PKD domain-containing protein n=1 Tax=Dysgonomonas capnocytophagoides TaxID=45254 RepID=UPI0039930889
MKRILIWNFMSLLFIMNIQAQKEMNWWYFGSYAGLNFGSTNNVVSKEGLQTAKMPTTLRGPISTNEGCFTLSDVEGNLLMSSDGMTVYNKNNVTMDSGTGLFGDPSATQSGIVVPMPGNSDRYYIFTVNAVTGYPYGICYSIVDLSLNDGLGKVISKNTNIRPGYTCENIASAAKADGSGYWLVNRTFGNFLVWDITASGITGPNIYPSNFSDTSIGPYAGEIRFSPDNTKIINTTYWSVAIISADFDPITGIISNAIVSTGHASPYGIEFSPSGEYLYIGGEGALGSKISWDDLRLNKVSTKMSMYAINWKLGPDKRIYGIRSSTRHLYVIMDPDKGGNDIRIFENYLLSGTSSVYGLPNFPASFFQKSQMPDFKCTSYISTFNLEITALGSEAPKTLEWNFGDGSPVVTEIVSSGTATYTQHHTYSSLGVYTIEVTPKKADGSMLSKTTHKIKIADCVIKTNRAIRHDLQNSITINLNR